MATNNTSKSGKAATEGTATTESTPRTETDTSKTQNSGDTYEVKDGDSLESVAAEVGMEPEELVSLNPEIAAEGRGSNFLYTGQTLRLK